MARKRYNPGATDIVGSLDTRHQSGRYARVDAIAPNVNISEDGAEAAANVFAPIASTNVVERERISEEAYHEADKIVGIVDGNAEGSQVPTEGLRTLDGSAPDAIAGKFEQIEQIGADAKAEAEALGTSDGGDAEPATAADVIDEDGESDAEAEASSDDEATDGGDDTSEADEADAGDAVADPLPEGWKDLTVAEMSELARDRGIEVKSSDKKAQIIAKLQQWEDAQS